MYVHPAFCKSFQAISDRTLCLLSSINSLHTAPVTLHPLDDMDHLSENIVFVSPCLAASAGLHHLELRVSDAYVRANLTREKLEVNFEEKRLVSTYNVPYGHEIKVQEIGKPVDFPRLLPTLDALPQLQNTRNKSLCLEKSLQKYFYTPKLLREQSIFAVTVKKISRFFLVTSIVCKSRSQNSAFLISTRETSLILNEPKGAEKNQYNYRLPRVDASSNFLNFRMNVKEMLSNGIATTSTKYENLLIDSIISNAPCLILVNELDSSKLSKMIGKIADSIGYRFLSFDGLAAFAHRYQVYHNLNTRVSGSIADKIHAFQYAIDMASASSPCIIHVANFHREISSNLSSMSKDGKSLDEYDDISRLFDALKRHFHTTSSSLCGNIDLAFPSVYIILSSMISLDGTLGSLFSHGNVVDLRSSQCCFEQSSKTTTVGKSLQCNLTKKGAMDFMLRYFESFPYRVADNESNEIIFDSVIKHFENGPFEGIDDLADNSLIPSVKWDNIGGLDYVRSEITDAIELPIKFPELFDGSYHTNNSSRKRPLKRSGLLLYGPPGTGKTLCAKAVASECGLPFLSIKGPELLGSYVGESECNIRNVFASARSAASANPKKFAILFFDELDSLAPKRGGMGDGGGVMERVVATLLGELDNESDNDANIFVIGATNRPDLLDPSLLRPGRFDRLIYLGLTTSDEDRAKILIAQMTKFKFEHNENVGDVVHSIIHQIPRNLSGADFSAVATGALMRSINRLSSKIETESRSEQCHLNEYICSLSDDELTPTLKRSDLVEAACLVTPSILEADLTRYNMLRARFGGENSRTTMPVDSKH